LQTLSVYLSSNTVAWVCERTIPTERPSAKLVPTFADRRCHGLSRPEPLLFLPSRSSIVLTRLCGPRFRPITSQKIW
jgi:hypothetical protein